MKERHLCARLQGCKVARLLGCKVARFEWNPKDYHLCAILACMYIISNGICQWILILKGCLALIYSFYHIHCIDINMRYIAMISMQIILSYRLKTIGGVELYCKSIE